MTNYVPVEEELCAYTNDLSRLFKDFDDAESLRFEDFCQIWRNLNFSFIHCGKRSAGDRNQGTERLLRCVSGFFNPETPYIYRIAAIYSAYAIYHTQICNPKVKIRMTIAMWNDLKQLQTLVRSLKHNDVDYVITRLENDKAFIFTAMPKQLEYGNKELMANMESSGSEVITRRKHYVADQYVQHTINNLDFLESIASLEDEYVSVKSDIDKCFKKKFDSKTIAYFNSIKDCRSGLIDDIENFREWIEANSHVQGNFDNSQRPAPKRLTEKQENASKICKRNHSEKVKDQESRAERIQALKLQSFRQPVPGVLQVQAESGGNDDSAIVKKRQTLKRRSAMIEKREMRPWVKRWKDRFKEDTPC